MDSDLQDLLDRAADAYAKAAPDRWVRIVLWCGRLLEEDGSTGGFRLPCIAVTFGPEGLSQTDVIPSVVDRLSAVELDRAVAGKPEESWTMLTIQLDRGGAPSYHFSHEAGRPLDDSTSDAYWDGLHEYVDRNRAELERLVEELRQRGALTEPQRAERKQGMGRLGRMFGRR